MAEDSAARLAQSARESADLPPPAHPSPATPLLPSASETSGACSGHADPEPWRLSTRCVRIGQRLGVVQYHVSPSLSK
jgi:hypothetical protein